MGLKVTFNAVDHEIVVTSAPISGVVTLDFKIDIYSDGKEDWIADSSLARHTFPIRAVGGDPLPGSLTLDSTFFLLPPWKIRPYDADHELIVKGNVYREDGATIFLPRPGRTITATLQTTFSAGATNTATGMTVAQFLSLK